MSLTSKPKQILSVVVRARKLKGYKTGRFTTLPLKICERLHIEPGDMLEIEIKKVVKAEVVEQEQEIATPQTEDSDEPIQVS